MILKDDRMMGTEKQNLYVQKMVTRMRQEPQTFKNWLCSIALRLLCFQKDLSNKRMNLNKFLIGLGIKKETGVSLTAISERAPEGGGRTG